MCILVVYSFHSWGTVNFVEEKRLPRLLPGETSDSKTLFSYVNGNGNYSLYRKNVVRICPDKETLYTKFLRIGFGLV